MKKIFTLLSTALVASAAWAGVTPPASATTSTWYMNGSAYDAGVTYGNVQYENEPVNVCIDGNDIYIDASFFSIASGWFKGTISGNSVTFDAKQEISDINLWGGTYPGYFSGNEEDGWDDIAAPAYATYTEADGAATLTFSSQLVVGVGYPGYDPYYVVLRMYEGITLTSGKGAEQSYQDQTAALPYRNDLDTETKFNTLGIADKNSNGSSYMWGMDWNTNNGYAALNCDGWTQNDEYLFLPGLKLEAGKKYTFSMDVNSSSSNYWQYFSVLMGKESTISGLTTEIIPQSFTYSTEWETVENEAIEVEETGYYYIAIRCTSYAYSGYFAVDNIAVEELQLDRPAEVEPSASAGSKGAMSATITFSLPSKNYGGTAYEAGKELDYAVSRGDIAIERGTGKAGDLIFVTDNNTDGGIVNGLNTYTVVVSDGAKQSKPASVQVFIGEDYPDNTKKVTGSYNAETKTVTLAWSAANKGVNGGYVTAKYNVYEGQNFYSAVKLNDEPLTATKYEFEYDLTSGEQGKRYFLVTTVNDLDETYGTVFAFDDCGAPYELPYEDAFADASHYYTDDSNMGGVYVDTYNGVLEFYSWDYSGNGWAEYKTGKIHLGGNADLSFTYTNQADAKFTVSVTDNTGATVQLGETLEVAVTTEPQTFSYNLADFRNAEWITVSFKVEMSTGYAYFDIDDLKIVAGEPIAEPKEIAIETATTGILVDNSFGPEDKKFTVTMQVTAPEGAAYAYSEGLMLTFNGEPSNVPFQCGVFGQVELDGTDATIVFTDPMLCATDDAEYEGEFRPFGTYQGEALITFFDAEFNELLDYAKFSGELVFENPNPVVLGEPVFNVDEDPFFGTIKLGELEANGLMMSFPEAKNVTPEMTVKVVASLSTIAPSFGQGNDAELGGAVAPDFHVVMENVEFEGSAMFGEVAVYLTDFVEYISQAGAGAFMVYVHSVEVLDQETAVYSWKYDEEDEEALPVGTLFEVKEPLVIEGEDVTLAVGLSEPNDWGDQKFTATVTIAADALAGANIAFAYTEGVLFEKELEDEPYFEQFTFMCDQLEGVEVKDEENVVLTCTDALFAVSTDPDFEGELREQGTYTASCIVVLADKNFMEVGYAVVNAEVELKAEATGMSLVVKGAETTIYNLQGQKVNRAQGIVIMNGKKVLVK